MPIAPFAPRPVPRDIEARRSRIAVAAAIIGIAAALVAYALSPSIRHAVSHAARGVGHAAARLADRVFPDHLASAPALPTEVLHGPAVTLKSLRGRTALITFWSPACASCAKAAASLETLARTSGAGRVVGVADGGTRAAALAFLRREHWSFANLRDGSGAVTKRYGIKSVSALPVTVAINSTGHITSTLHGPQTLAHLQAALRPFHDTK